MLDVLVLDKRRRLVDYLLQQEEFVKCCWDREHEKYKQSKLESLNRRDSGLGNRSLLHEYSDFYLLNLLNLRMTSSNVSLKSPLGNHSPLEKS